MPRNPSSFLLPIAHVFHLFTMSLLRLPAEILRQIFDEIGSSFFYEDLGRLTVCKKWFNFAVPMCFKCITLSQEMLRRLVTSGVAIKPSPLKDSLETLDLELKGYIPCYAQESISWKAIAQNEASEDSSVRTWMEALYFDLAQLAIVAQQSHKLRKLCIRAQISLSQEAFDLPEDYLSLPTMQALLSVESLNVLVLDLSGSSFVSSEQQGNDSHICPVIGTLLRTLRCLHLRMRSVCPDILEPRGNNNCLHLSVVAINLSLMTTLPEILQGTHANRCGSGPGGLPQLKAEMVEQAEILANQMASPKIIRILTQTLPDFEMLSLDVLTGKKMKLDYDMAWDEDGEAVDLEPESEILR